ncbi:MAG: NAD(P)/FAD-dependent oxidoreductase [Pseudomonadota bacterium]
MSTPQYDVIIIGAGFAGIAAARELGWRGKRVCVLEGADRIGGRAWSTHMNGVPIELGGGYVHWSQPHTWAEISRYGLEIVERPYYTSTNAMRNTRLLVDGEAQAAFTPEDAAQISQAFRAFMAPAKDVFPTPYDPFATDGFADYDHLSNEDRIKQMDLTDLQRNTLLRTTGMQCNNAAREGGYLEALRWYALAHNNDDIYAASVSRYTLAQGTGHLLDLMARDAGADIVLNARVEAVHQDADGVRVTCTAGDFSAEACIVATGVNVWKGIDFTPELSPEKAAFTREELSGKGGKIYVELKGRFQDSRWSAVGGPIISVLPHWVGDESSVIVVFTSAEHPFNAITKESLQREISRFDPELEVLSYTHHDWIADDLVQGTWGNFRPGQFTKYFRQALEPEGRIHFANADIAKGWRGFFDGALESGIRAGRTV